MRRLSIRQLVEWAYADELVHAALPEGTPRQLTVRYSPGMASMNLTKEAISSSVRMDLEAPFDAYRVHAAVMKLGDVSVEVMRDPTMIVPGTPAGTRPSEKQTIVVHRASLVVMHGQRCDEPDWVARPALRMKPGDVVYHPRFRKPSFCRVAPDGDLPWEIDRARAIYRVWVAALGEICAAVSSRLESHVLTAELPALTPWRGNP